MSFEEKVLSGILVGLVVWLLSKTVMYLLKRERIKTGLLIDIELHIKSIAKSNEYLKVWLPTLKPDTTITYSARHASDDYAYFGSVLPVLPEYFGKETFSRILRYYKSAEEYDVLLGGFFFDVSAWKSEKRKLTDEDLSYLARKMDRISSLGQILAERPITKLSSLPIDYEGKISAKSIIK